MNPLVKAANDKLQVLEDESNNNLDVVRPRSLSKKKLLFVLPNLPSSTGAAYTIPNIRKGFIFNGQLDAEITNTPSFWNLVNTFRGNVTEKMIEQYFEIFFMGTILGSWGWDTDSTGKVVLKRNDIDSENRHCVKM